MRSTTGRLNRCVAGLAVASLVVVLGAGSAQAAPVTVVAGSLTSLLGNSPQAIGAVQITDMSAGNLAVDTYSQAYTDGQGLYAYLYQMNNTGNSSNSPIEEFTVWPFAGGSAGTTLGYLTGDIPTGFLTGGGACGNRASVRVLTSGTQFAFYYPDLDGLAIDPGNNSVVMYIMSNYSPAQITGNVIDGSVGSGDVVGPVPEPGALLILALGSVGLIRRRR